MGKFLLADCGVVGSDLNCSHVVIDPLDPVLGSGRPLSCLLPEGHCLIGSDCMAFFFCRGGWMGMHVGGAVKARIDWWVALVTVLPPEPFAAS